MKIIIKLILLTLFVGACSSEKSRVTPTENSPKELENKSFHKNHGYIHSYVKLNPYKEQLETCPYYVRHESMCNLKTLPFLGQATHLPTQDDILNRLVVSHDYLGDRFAALLSKYYNKDLALMFKSITAVVVSDNLETSHYLASNAVIYLKATYFAKNRNEYKKANLVNDTRGIRHKLNFETWRHIVKDGIWYDYSDSKYAYRKEAELIRCVYHELAHANDFYPHYYIGEVAMDENLNIFHLQIERRKELLNLRLDALYNRPINDYINYVYNSGALESSFSEFYDHDFVELFSQEPAVSLYSYSADLEDFAELISYYFLLKNHKIENMILITNKANRKDRMIAWGQVNRLLDPLVRPRVEKAVKLLFPDEVVNFDNLEGVSKVIPSGTRYTELESVL